MNDKEKLISLLILTDPNPYTCESESGSCELTTCTECRARSTADLLIAHGVTTHEWISVKDRLPEQGERVLATDGEFVGELYVNSRCQWQRYNVNDHSLMMSLDILWWMPLPEPPKGE